MSLGSSSAALTSRSSRSRMALTYSKRFIRREATRPGFGSAAAARSSADVSAAVNVSTASRSGRGRPAGGICPARSLRTTFSSVSAWAPTRSRSTRSSSRSAVRRRSLWQVMQ